MYLALLVIIFMLLSKEETISWTHTLVTWAVCQIQTVNHFYPQLHTQFLCKIYSFFHSYLVRNEISLAHITPHIHTERNRERETEREREKKKRERDINKNKLV